MPAILCETIVQYLHFSTYSLRCTVKSLYSAYIYIYLAVSKNPDQLVEVSTEVSAETSAETSTSFAEVSAEVSTEVSTEISTEVYTSFFHNFHELFFLLI